MPFTIKKLANMPVIVVMPAGAGIATEFPDIERRLVALLNTQDEQVIVIADLRRIALSLDDVISASNNAARSTSAILCHLNVRETILISEDSLVRLASRGMDSPIFGGLSFKVFASPELALDYCRGQAAEDPGSAHRQTG